MERHLKKNLGDHNYSRFLSHTRTILGILRRCPTIDRVQSVGYTHKPPRRAENAVIKLDPNWHTALLFQFQSSDGRTQWRITFQGDAYRCAQEIKDKILQRYPTIEFRYDKILSPKNRAGPKKILNPLIAFFSVR